MVLWLSEIVITNVSYLDIFIFICVSFFLCIFVIELLFFYFTFNFYYIVKWFLGDYWPCRAASTHTPGRWITQRATNMSISKVISFSFVPLEVFYLHISVLFLFFSFGFGFPFFSFSFSFLLPLPGIWCQDHSNRQANIFSASFLLFFFSLPLFFLPPFFFPPPFFFSSLLGLWLHFRSHCCCAFPRTHFRASVALGEYFFHLHGPKKLPGIESRQLWKETVNV